MEHQKVLNLLNKEKTSKFVTRKWNVVNDQSFRKYGQRKEILYNTEVLKSNLCDYNDDYILSFEYKLLGATIVQLNPNHALAILKNSAIVVSLNI